MAILNLEDLVGNVEVLVWPKQYEIYRDKLEVDNKVFITGRVRIEDEKDGQLAADSIMFFEEMPQKIFLRYKNMETYEAGKDELERLLRSAPGNDEVCIYLETEKKQKKYSNKIDSARLLPLLKDLYGDENVRPADHT